MIGQVLLQFSKFLRSTIHLFLSLVELERWLAEMRSFPHQHRRQHSSAQDTSGQGYSPDPRTARRVWGPDYLFLSTITGVVVQGFRSSSVSVTHKGYLVESCRPLWFWSSQANRCVFSTLSRHSPLVAVSRTTSIISLRLGSSASLSSSFLSSCYVGSHCSAFLFC